MHGMFMLARIVLLIAMLVLMYIAFRKRIRIVRNQRIPSIHAMLSRKPDNVKQVQWVLGSEQIFFCCEMTYRNDESVILYAMMNGDSGCIEIIMLHSIEGGHALSMVCRDGHIVWIDSKTVDPDDLVDDPRLPWRLTPLEERQVYDSFLSARRHAKCMSR